MRLLVVVAFLMSAAVARAAGFPSYLPLPAPVKIVGEVEVQGYGQVEFAVRGKAEVVRGKTWRGQVDAAGLGADKRYFAPFVEAFVRAGWEVMLRDEPANPPIATFKRTREEFLTVDECAVRRAFCARVQQRGAHGADDFVLCVAARQPFFDASDIVGIRWIKLEAFKPFYRAPCGVEHLFGAGVWRGLAFVGAFECRRRALASRIVAKIAAGFACAGLYQQAVCDGQLQRRSKRNGWEAQAILDGGVAQKVSLTHRCHLVLALIQQAQHNQHNLELFKVVDLRELGVHKFGQAHNSIFSRARFLNDVKRLSKYRLILPVGPLRFFCTEISAMFLNSVSGL